MTVGGVASNGVTFTVVPTGQPTMEVDKASLNFAAVNSGTSFTSQTPAQTVNIAQTGTQNTVTWTAVSDAPWLTVSPASGSGSAALSVGVQSRLDASAGGRDRDRHDYGHVYGVRDGDVHGERAVELPGGSGSPDRLDRYAGRRRDRASGVDRRDGLGARRHRSRSRRTVARPAAG